MKIASEGKLGKIWSVGVCVYGEKKRTWRGIQKDHAKDDNKSKRKAMNVSKILCSAPPFPRKGCTLSNHITALGSARARTVGLMPVKPSLDLP